MPNKILPGDRVRSLEQSTFGNIGLVVAVDGHWIIVRFDHMADTFYFTDKQVILED